jgi:ATP-dependent DNA helicase RecQ
VEEAVRQVWGFSGLRPDQARAVEAVLAGRDALVVLPTGGGKSLCYQAPALVRDGLTLVLSPLISLMKDQLDGLLANGVAAAALTSLQSADERREVRRRLRNGELRILFAAPERLSLGGFPQLLREAGLSLVAVDEAHCISHWGHDFRPDYRQIGELTREVRSWAARAGGAGVPVLALTATATPRVREDIAGQLGLRDPVVVIGDFDRPNLTYRALPRGDLLAQVLDVIERHPGEAGIVYCQRRKDTESLAARLKSSKVRALAYHAGLPRDERRLAQDAFQRDEVDVVVATVAFGMGIDRPDVRFVVHASLPKGMEQYSQESGRAGRDGLPAECVLLFGGGDFHTWNGLMDRAAEEAGVSPDSPDQVDARLRLGHVWSFANTASCRHSLLVEYFGQPWTRGPCGACDSCLGELTRAKEPLVLAQKILSCVVRCKQRYGAAHVTQVLRGKATEAVRRAGHEQLSTFGLLAEHSIAEVRSWIDQLVAQACLIVAPGRYPTLSVSQLGAELLRGEREVELLVPRASAKRGRKRSAIKIRGIPKPSEGDPEPDPTIYERLRKLRTELAQARSVPPYVIFHDQTLARIAGYRPTDLAALGALRGIGERKLADYGAKVLAAVSGEASAATPERTD